MAIVNTNMLILARESRGFTQAELAGKIGIIPTHLSKIERNTFDISDDLLNKVSEQTNYPLTFFYQHGDIFPENLNYRKREKVAQKLLNLINARVNIVRYHVQYITHSLSIANPSLPVFNLTEEITPNLIAKKLRKLWEINTPVIENVSELLESKGIAISSFNFGTERVDSRSVLTEDKYPIIVLNNTLLGDRQRFSAIYQLGYLVMHTFSITDWNRDIAHDANLFAAEFLMPEEYIRSDFEQGVTIPLLGALKNKWKVSMIALMYRADDLGFLSPNQKRYLLQQFNELKIRRREPFELDISIEKPNQIQNWIKELKVKNTGDINTIAALLNLNTEEFIKLYN